MTGPGSHAEPFQVRQGVRHQALAAGLVDGAAAVLDDHDLQPGPCGMHGGGQARGPAPGHQ